MKYVEVVAEPESSKDVSAIAEEHDTLDLRLGAIGEDGMQHMRLVVAEKRLQDVLDALQDALEPQSEARIMVLSVEAALPRPEEQEQGSDESVTESREKLLEEAEKNARLDRDYFLLVGLSTVVAAIGLLESNVAVVIGAMVIAPLLGPNIALSLGTALGDVPIVRKSALKLAIGISLAVTLSVVIGLAIPSELTSPELMSRTSAGLDSIALALASGAAAALSITTGLPSVLVGVMVAVALLPPATTLGLTLGHGDFSLAAGAGLLLIVNIVSVNLASKVVLLFKGIGPRTSLEKEKARRAMIVYIVGWLAALVILIGVIVARGTLL